MNLNEAKALTGKYIKSKNTIHVTSDGTVYLNSDIEALEKHALENKLELFYIKPEKKEVLESTKKTKA